MLNEAISEPNTASRIGGDEFAIIMPFVDERACEATVERIKQLVDINNQYYSQLKLSLSIGWATSRDHESLESVVKRADMAMYENKHARMRRNVLEI